jgi:hypothetical protein
MPIHRERNHNGAPLPDGFAASLETPANEMDLTKKLLKDMAAS